jgi:fluoride exporter
MIMLKNCLLVGIGGGIGAMLRYVLSSVIKNNSFPLNTLLINIVGSLAIGIVFALATKSDSFSESLKLFLATGICGGFTTFSAFSLENMQLLKEGNYAVAGFYIFTSIFFCLLAVFVGFTIINYSS